MAFVKLTEACKATHAYVTKVTRVRRDDKGVDAMQHISLPVPPMVIVEREVSGETRP